MDRRKIKSSAVASSADGTAVGGIFEIDADQQLIYDERFIPRPCTNPDQTVLHAIRCKSDGNSTD